VLRLVEHSHALYTESGKQQHGQQHVAQRHDHKKEKKKEKKGRGFFSNLPQTTPITRRPAYGCTL
jgi:hypothetical protein